MNIMNMPPIKGGSDKQKMFADSVRLNFLTFVESELPDRLEEAYSVIRIRTNFKWWIDKAKKINSRHVKLVLTNNKNLIVKHGSEQGVRDSIALAEQKSKDYFINDAPLGGILKSPSPRK